MLKLATKFYFGTKAETLTALTESLNESSIPRFLFISYENWSSNRDKTLSEIQAFHCDVEKVIARSSSKLEDGDVATRAGEFLSIPNLQTKNRKALGEAIDQVFNSFGENPQKKDSQVIVQEMIIDVSMSGVALTHSLKDGAPYYVINYDDQTGATDTVTSGRTINKTIYIYRNNSQKFISKRFGALIKAIKEIEFVTDNDFLDIEFSINKEFEVKIFQVRQITAKPNWEKGLATRIEETITGLEENIGHRLSDENGLLLNKTIFGKMPDWNPAEIIGNSPKKLAFSLYRHLITDKCWRQARTEMGYHDPLGALMESFGGQPYINVRKSCLSFIPSEIPEPTATKLVDFWLSRLAANKHLHDKIEFEVALTCWSFDFDQKCLDALPPNFSAPELEQIKKAYQNLTNNLITGKIASIDEILADISSLEKKYLSLKNKTHGWEPNIDLIEHLLDDAIYLGTIPFAKLARHAFIAKTLLDSLVFEKLLTGNQVDMFLNNLETVATEFTNDTRLLGQQKLSEEEFFERYGHLRPGTYDILSRRYDQRGKDILQQRKKKIGRKNNTIQGKLSFFDKEQEHLINECLKLSNINCQFTDIIKYCETAIKGRELAKFVFTKNVSDCLEIITLWGEKNGLDREDLSHLDIKEILSCEIEHPNKKVGDYLRQKSLKEASRHRVACSIYLPYLITQKSDLFVVPRLIEQPNFITSKSVSGSVIVIKPYSERLEDIDGKIVLIESADPGYDWIFNFNILGLVTKFGGVNSHMAIRCAEFDIPAAIGCGEQLFEKVSNSQYITLNSPQAVLSTHY